MSWGCTFYIGHGRDRQTRRRQKEGEERGGEARPRKSRIQSKLRDRLSLLYPHVSIEEFCKKSKNGIRTHNTEDDGHTRRRHEGGLPKPSKSGGCGRAEKKERDDDDDDGNAPNANGRSTLDTRLFFVSFRLFVLAAAANSNRRVGCAHRARSFSRGLQLSLSEHTTKRQQDRRCVPIPRNSYT